MVRSVCWLALSIAALVLVGNASVKAATIVVAPSVAAFYGPVPAPYAVPPVVVVPAPRVAYYPAPVVSYYYTPSVSYYAAPAAVVPGAAVTTTYYGLLGRPRFTSTYYYPPVAVAP
jgi:hypothetical protein